jgi:hypothetical protein
MNNTPIYGIDFGSGYSQTVITVRFGGRAYGKTYFSKLWLQYYHPDLLSKHLIRRLAAEAVINISINS